MELGIFWLIVMGIAALIVLGRFRMLRKEAEQCGTKLSIREASVVRTLSCICPLTAAEVASRMLDGVPAGDLVCTWDQERGAYCFRSELPDGSIPQYFKLSVLQLPEGTRITLTRQRDFLHGGKDVVMRLSGFLTHKLGATNYSWMTDVAVW